MKKMTYICPFVGVETVEMTEVMAFTGATGTTPVNPSPARPIFND